MCAEMESVGRLVDKLASGWLASRSATAEYFVDILRNSLGARAKLETGEDDELRFSLSLDGIRLKGMDDVPCLLIAGEGPQTAGMLQNFWRDALAPGRVPFVLALSDAALAQARSKLPSGRYLLLSGADLVRILDAPAPTEFLAHLLTQRLPKRSLVAFNYLLPPKSTMFFGRAEEIERLRLEEDVSFAIAGPSRIGKTSLVKQYQHLRNLEGSSAANRRFYIDFYDCPSNNAVAQFLAMKIQGSSWAHRISDDDLIGFLKYQKKRLGGPLELLLDEVDDVCWSQTFEVLGQAVKMRLCRLILCGRGGLLRLATRGQSQLAFRLEMLPLKPLDVLAARHLILGPLGDLGFDLPDPEGLVTYVFGTTGRLPHLIQYWGKRIANLAIEEGVQTITCNFAKSLSWDFVTAEMFLSPLDELGAQARLIALFMLRNDVKKTTIPALQQIAEELGLDPSLEHIRDLCDDLVIGNILAWHDGDFHMANALLLHFAEQMGYLTDEEWVKAQQAITSQR